MTHSPYRGMESITTQNMTLTPRVGIRAQRTLDHGLNILIINRTQNTSNLVHRRRCPW